MALTAELLADFQADLGITNSQTVFTDAQLQRLFTRASENYPKAVYFAYRQLLSQANKYRDYTAGMTSEKLSQVRGNLEKSMAMWKEEAFGSSNQFQSLGLRLVPEQQKERPWRNNGSRRVDRYPWDDRY